MNAGVRVQKPDTQHLPGRLEKALPRVGTSAAVVVLGIAAVDLAGWATGLEALTRIHGSWPQMTPWTAVLMAMLAMAILVQSGQPSRTQVWVGCGLAMAAGVLAALFLVEYATGGSFGLDQVWFGDAVRAVQQTWPGRPSPQTASSVLLVSVLVGLTRLELRLALVAWRAGIIATAAPLLVIAGAYLFEAPSVFGVTRSTGMGVPTTCALVLLVLAVIVTRPDRNPVAWLLARPDRWTLIRMVGVLAGPPLIIAFSRLAFLYLGVHEAEAWVLSISTSTLVVGVATFHLSQQEQRLLIEKQLLSRQRADAVARFGTLFEAAPDAMLVVDSDGRIRMANAQTDRIFGYPREELVGSEVEMLLPPRFREKHRRYRTGYVADPTVRSMGAGVQLWALRRDGAEFPVGISLSPLHTEDGLQVLAAIRDVTERQEYEQRLRSQRADLIAAQQKLERLAHFDSLTGLVNRGEASPASRPP